MRSKLGIQESIKKITRKIEGVLLLDPCTVLRCRRHIGLVQQHRDADYVDTTDCYKTIFLIIRKHQNYSLFSKAFKALCFEIPLE